MLNSMSDENLLRLIIAGVSLILILFIVVSWKFKAKQTSRHKQSRVDPEVKDVVSTLHEDTIEKTEEDYKEQSSLGFESEISNSKRSQIGARKSDEYEKLVMLYLAAQSGHLITGAELVLAAEKVGLVYGHHNIYHRLSDSVQSNEPVFSMANVIQPGYFDLRQIDSLQTPGVSFFLTLPGPVTAIQAWDMMLPIAERMAQLLDGVLLDSDRNALGRQRILHIKEDLRSFDREKERQTIKPGR
jgi:cell division protein ZipA